MLICCRSLTDDLLLIKKQRINDKKNEARLSEEQRKQLKKMREKKEVAHFLMPDAPLPKKSRLECLFYLRISYYIFDKSFFTYFIFQKIVSGKGGLPFKRGHPGGSTPKNPSTLGIEKNE